MNNAQNKFVQKILSGIPSVLKGMKSGGSKSELILGRKRIGERVIVLKLVAEVDLTVNDPGVHGSASPHEDIGE